MLNLLVISDSPRAEDIKKILKRSLNVIIDVATDFDHGLKVVFEKRPVAVFIQYQTGGITGESVARHIRMLLGDDAPLFILLSTGNGILKPVLGFCEQIVDFGPSNAAVAENMLKTLKATLGSQWQKILINPEPSTSVVPATNIVKKKPAKEAGSNIYGNNEMTALPPVEASSSAKSSVTAFRINPGTGSDEEPIPEDLLLALGQNYRSKSRIIRGVVVACLCLIAVGWYLVSQKYLDFAPFREKTSQSTGSGQTTTVGQTDVPAVMPKPVVTAKPKPVEIKSLPSFIPQKGLDVSYGEKNAGWERYIDKNIEFRLFRGSDRIQAVQVIALENGYVPELLINTVLKEYTGSQKYLITSREVQSGISIENGRVENVAQVKLYKNKSSVKAFVVSVN